MVHETLSHSSSVALIQKWLRETNFSSLSHLGKKVCQHFDFHNPLGEPQLTSVLVTLKQLEKKGLLSLPARAVTSRKYGPKLLEHPVEKSPVPHKMSDLGRVDILLIQDTEKRKIWNRLIVDEHPQGMTIFAGRQLRYLFHSQDFGYLGAIGFAAAAKNMQDRDQWIGWTHEQRRVNLQKIVGLNRFLIRPHVQCKYLATKLLSRVLKRLPKDFKERYGNSPFLVESFCEPRYRGTSLLAANFIKIGETKGRGRQDREFQQALSKKKILMYQLLPEQMWRKALGVKYSKAGSSEAWQNLDRNQWIEHEFDQAPLGDIRRQARLVKTVSMLDSYYGVAASGQGTGNNSEMQAFYRFIEQPDESEVTVDNILKPHLDRTIERMRTQKVVLAIMDTTTLNFNTRPGCEGLQWIGSNQTKAKSFGLYMHNTLAVTSSGLPLGLLNGYFDAPDQEKKTERWFRGFRKIEDIAHELTRKNQVIAVMDREGDIYQLFAEQKAAKRAEILVRVRHNRKLEESAHSKLFVALDQSSVAQTIRVDVTAQSMRKKTSKASGTVGRKKRTAVCEIRFRPVTLKSPIKGEQSIVLWGVSVEEKDPPSGVTSLSWKLLTSVKISDADQAITIVEYYLQRWKIEDLFRIIKSGLKLEKSAFRTRDRLERIAAITSVIGWRILLMCLLGREVPDYDPKIMFSDDELSALNLLSKEFNQAPPKTLREAVSIMAIFGGHQNRKNDPAPGSKIIWRGMERLGAASAMYRVVKKHHQIT